MRWKDPGSGKQRGVFPFVCRFPDVRSAEPKGGHGIAEHPRPRCTVFQLCVRKCSSLGGGLEAASPRDASYPLCSVPTPECGLDFSAGF